MSKLSVKNKLVAIFLIILFLSIPFLYGCRDNDGPKIKKIEYINSSGKISTIFSYHMHTITSVYLVSYYGTKILKNITNEYNNSNEKKKQILLQEISSTSIVNDIVFRYSELEYKILDLTYRPYSPEFQTFVKFKIQCVYESSYYIDLDQKNNLSTITYPVLEGRDIFKEYYNDQCTMKTFSIPTSNLLTIEYEG